MKGVIVIMKRIYVIFLYLFIFVIFTKSNAYAYSNGDCAEVNSNKTWIIEFNKEIDFNKLNKLEILIKNSKATLIGCNVLKGDNGNEIKVSPPQGGYDLNENYTLIITKQAYPRLQKEISLNFSIINQNFSDEPSWNNNLILNFNKQLYTVTNETTTDIDSKIDTIVYYGNLGKIYKLYSIKGVKDYSKIAVKTNQGYLIAIVNQK